MAYNHVTLVGNLVTDPVKSEVGKREKSSFQIGVDRYMGKDNPQEVDFFQIVAWGKLAEICNSHLLKEKKVLIDGRVQITNEESKWITEIIAENVKFLK